MPKPSKLQETMRPPGLVTRANSVMAAAGSPTHCNRYLCQTMSKVASGNGNARTSPFSNVTLVRLSESAFRRAKSRYGSRSQRPQQVALDSAAAIWRVMLPDPQPASKTDMPGLSGKYFKWEEIGASPRLCLKPLALFVAMYCVNAVSHGNALMSVSPSANQCIWASRSAREKLPKWVSCVDLALPATCPLSAALQTATLTFVSTARRIAPRE